MTLIRPIILLTTTVLLWCSAAVGHPNKPTPTTLADYEYTLGELYIAAYSDLAVTEMKRLAIPASIILAQGMLESSYGKSELATKANNHFGMKCDKGWRGDTYTRASGEYKNGEYYTKQSCFRQYATAEESYKDHSEFLASRSNYVFLFLENTTDYTTWAKGLQKAGYATDPSYATKLISKIKQFSLDQFDNVDTERSYNNSTEEQEYKEDLTSLKKRIKTIEGILHEAEMCMAKLKEQLADKSAAFEMLKAKHEALKAAVNEKIKILDQNLAQQYSVIDNYQGRLQRVENIQQNIIKSDPLANYFNEDGTPKDNIEIFPTQQLDADGIFYQSGRKATVVTEEKNLIEIADEYNINFKSLLRYNDLDNDIDLPKGYYVYLEPKANYVENKKTHQVIVGETVHTISQRYGIKASKLYNRNNLDKGDEPAAGEHLFLNKRNKDKPKLKVASDNKTKHAEFGAGGANR